MLPSAVGIDVMEGIAQQSQTHFRTWSGTAGGGRSIPAMMGQWPQVDTEKSMNATVKKRSTSSFSRDVLTGSVTRRSEQGQHDDFAGEGRLQGGRPSSSASDGADSWEQQQEVASHFVSTFAEQANWQLHACIQHHPCGIAKGRLQTRTSIRETVPSITSIIDSTHLLNQDRSIPRTGSTGRQKDSALQGFSILLNKSGS